jgi:predicted ArsR family transcriptional regulator
MLSTRTRDNANVPKRPPHDRLDPLGALAALAAPLRRAIYEFVLSRDEPIERDDAATAVQTGRPVATFHLEKLVAAGLLEVAPPEVEGRGRGRPAKRYQVRLPSPDLSVPPRNYGLFGKILRRSDRGRSSSRDPRLLAAAREIGGEIGRDIRSGAGRRGPVTALVRALSELAYEPKLDGATIRLRNCPVRAIADEAPEQTCALNLALLEGLVHSADAHAFAAVPDPAPRRSACCVLIRLEPT